MSEKFLLERATQEVEVEGRTFRLREMSGADLREYIRLVNEPLNTVVQEIAEGGEDLVVDALQRLQKAENLLFSWLLSVPTDGKAPADDALLDAMSPRQRRLLLEIQDQLNDTEAALGNVRNLLAMAQARRAAKALAGPN